MILTSLTISRNGYSMTPESDWLEKLVTYVLAPLVAGGVAIWGTVKWVIPKVVDSYLRRQEKLSEAEIEERREARKSTQEEKRLALEYSKTEATEAQRMLAEIISDLQAAKSKDDDFIRSTVFSFERRLTAAETKTRLLVDLLNRGIISADDTPAGDYETWKKQKLEATNQLSNPAGGQAGGDGE
jgi:hypothetical protein